MKIDGKSLLVTLPALAAPTLACSKQEAPKPNVVFLLFDDLGYGDLGCYGQEKIETPNIDALASQGLLFTDMYTCAPLSSPSRCCLMTGQHAGHSQIRFNDEKRFYDGVDHVDVYLDHSHQGQFPMAEGTRTIGHIMKDAGYATGMFGKWGLGWPGSASVPGTMGFDTFYGYNCQALAHNYYPVSLWDNDEEVRIEGNELVLPRTLLDEGADPLDIHSYDKFTGEHYSPDLIFDRLTRFVSDHSGEPFFAMWTTTVPHSNVQAPLDEVMYYVNKLGDEEPITDPGNYLPNRYPHATYAAMVTHVDTQLGKLVQQLKDLGIYDNTIIIISSDNGPACNGNSPMEYFKSGGPFRCRQGWGKSSLHEGGVRMPFIISWNGHMKPAVTDRISSFADLMPTLSEICGQEAPENDGISFAPMFKGADVPGHEWLYWEFPGKKGWVGVRMGQWKGILRKASTGNQDMELYDLATDPQELVNVAADHQDVVMQLWRVVKDQHRNPVNNNPLYITNVSFPEALED